MNELEFKKPLRRMVLEEIRNIDLPVITESSLREAAPLVDLNPKKLKDRSKAQLVGDPLEDVELNQMVNDAGSDEKAATTVGVTAGAKKGGTRPTAGQPNPKFKSKTDK